MDISFTDLCRKPSKILRALDANEPITIFYRGRPKAVIQPLPERQTAPAIKMKDHPAFGMWKDRDDLKDVAAHVRELRRTR